jgi:hypothetical protein
MASRSNEKNKGVLSHASIRELPADRSRFGTRETPEQPLSPAECSPSMLYLHLSRLRKLGPGDLQPNVGNVPYTCGSAAVAAILVMLSEMFN